MPRAPDEYAAPFEAASPRRVIASTLRQILAPWHGRAVDEEGNDANVALERRLDLDADEIVRIVDATPAVFVGARNPSLSDDSDEGVALADALGQNIEEIDAWRNIVDVKKRRSLVQTAL